jgi:hypothetical protein
VMPLSTMPFESAHCSRFSISVSIFTGRAMEVYIFEGICLRKKKIV